MRLTTGFIGVDIAPPWIEADGRQTLVTLPVELLFDLRPRHDPIPVPDSQELSQPLARHQAPATR
jgi:hypothetical protein